MDRKKAPHKLQVEDSKQDDNSIVEMTQAKMDELKIFRGDAVILKGMCPIINLSYFVCHFLLSLSDENFPLNVINGLEPVRLCECLCAPFSWSHIS